MPTPFMHLDYAERMIQHPTIPNSTVELLRNHWPAFYLGSIAADYQSICDVPREKTHFYPIPLPPNHDTLATLFEQHPALCNDGQLPTETVTFMAAYLAHLHFDVVWYREVMLPYFAFNPLFEGVERDERFTIHNILLTYLDRQALGALPASAETTLIAADSPTNIDYINAEQLDRFRNKIAKQLLPDAPIITVQLYADRMGMSASEFGQHLADPVWMQTKVFDRIPLDEVLAILDKTIGACVEIIADYTNTVVD